MDEALGTKKAGHFELLPGFQFIDFEALSV
jgi:hypothetical protein